MPAFMRNAVKSFGNWWRMKCRSTSANHILPTASFTELKKRVCCWRATFHAGPRTGTSCRTRSSMTEARPGTKDLELEEAVAAILAAMPPPVGESVGLAEAHGRVLTEPVGSPGDLPRFDNSAVDGYAVLAKDTGSASPEAPARLTLVGTVAAGKIFQGELAAGACVRIATGAALPRGADAVVMQESTATETSSTKILIFEAVKPWENVRLRGEDVKAGSALVG